MIHPVDGGKTWVISSRGVWRPGSYESEKAANAAVRLPDEVLQELQDHASPGPITLEMIRSRASILGEQK